MMDLQGYSKKDIAYATALYNAKAKASSPYEIKKIMMNEMGFTYTNRIPTAVKNIYKKLVKENGLQLPRMDIPLTLKLILPKSKKIDNKQINKIIEAVGVFHSKLTDRNYLVGNRKTYLAALLYLSAADCLTQKEISKICNCSCVAINKRCREVLVELAKV